MKRTENKVGLGVVLGMDALVLVFMHRWYHRIVFDWHSGRMVYAVTLPLE